METDQITTAFTMSIQETRPPAPLPRHPGLVCRQCGCRRFYTVYTRRRHDGIVRRKRCLHCDQAITTREKII